MNNTNYKHTEEAAIEVSVARGVTRFTLRLSELDRDTGVFPQCLVTAAVIPNRFLGGYRVVVTVGSAAGAQTVPELGQDNIEDRTWAMSWAKECLQGAYQFWQDCADAH